MKKTQAERAQSYFDRNPQVTKLVGTSDGFLFERNQDALSHSTTLDNKQLKPYYAKGVTPEAEDTQSEFLKLSVKKIKEQLPEMQDVEQLNALLEEEKASEDSRSTAVEALEARIAELTEDK